MVLPRSVFNRRGFETSRSTSVFLSSARAIRDPSSRGAISRTIVSTSGSSGTLDFAPGDVAPPRLAVERDPFRGRGAGPRGGRHVAAQSGDAEDTSARRAQRAVRVAGGAGMEDDHIVADRR